MILQPRPATDYFNIQSLKAKNKNFSSNKEKFTDMSPQPFGVVRNKRHPADILNDGLM
jgi:hypothetical protein